MVSYIEFYCVNSDCSVREVLVKAKHYGEEKPPEIGKCPACGNRLKKHWAQDAKAYDEMKRREARCSVNVQRFERDNPDSMLICATVFCDDSLP